MLARCREEHLLLGGSLVLIIIALLLGAPPAARAKDLQTKLAEAFFLRLPHALEVAAKSSQGGSAARWREQVPEESTRPSPGARLLPITGPFQASGACSTNVGIGFAAGRDTVYFTNGRSPGKCDGIPRMIWKPVGAFRSDPLPALSDYNITAMWLTKTYVVFGLEANYERGSHAERFAFWNLDTGAMSLTTPAHWDSEQAARHARKEVLAGLTDWHQADVAQGENSVTLVQGSECAEAWPETHEFARCAP